MKNLVLFAIGLILFSNLQAQNKIIKTNIIHTLIQDFNLGLEYTLTAKASVEAGLTLYKFDFFSNDDFTTSSGPGLYCLYKKYLGKKEGPRGIYIAPQAAFNRYKVTTPSNVKGSVNTSKLGALIGRQWIIGEKSGLVIDLSGGLRYAKSKYKSFFEDNGSNSLDIQLNLSVGYAF